jgi:hypothetical protein
MGFSTKTGKPRAMQASPMGVCVALGVATMTACAAVWFNNAKGSSCQGTPKEAAKSRAAAEGSAMPAKHTSGCALMRSMCILPMAPAPSTANGIRAAREFKFCVMGFFSKEGWA